MPNAYQRFGNDLYFGRRSINVVGKRKLWFAIASVLVILSILVPVFRGGFNLGIEFTGGSEFLISNPTQHEQKPAADIVAEYSATPARVASLGDGGVRVQSDTLPEADEQAVREKLAEAYGVKTTDVTVSTIGPSWGSDVTRQMLTGLVFFIVAAMVLMALYFRTVKMSLAAILALLHDLIVTAGIYALTGFEVTPAAVIGFLTIVGYSLYDKVVVFDKVRENTKLFSPRGDHTFAELINLAINQTLVRSINTSVVAVLPVGAILFIGAFILGAGTLRDISLSLFVGILVAALSTIFLAGPLYAAFRAPERRIKHIDSVIRHERGEDVEIVPAPRNHRALSEETYRAEAAESRA